jgi:hypothetical protein
MPMMCFRTVSLASFVAAAAFAVLGPRSYAEDRVWRAPMPSAVAVRDVIKPNPHDGALAAPVLSDTWWMRVASGPDRKLQRKAPDRIEGVGGRGAPEKID